MPLCIEDEEGRVVWWARRVDPYGLIDVRPDAKLEYNLRWPGHYYDPETGLHYNRHRYYDPMSAISRNRARSVKSAWTGAAPVTIHR